MTISPCTEKRSRLPSGLQQPDWRDKLSSWFRKCHFTNFNINFKCGDKFSPGSALSHMANAHRSTSWSPKPWKNTFCHEYTNPDINFMKIEKKTFTYIHWQPYTSFLFFMCDCSSRSTGGMFKKKNSAKSSMSYLNRADGVEARTWLPSGDQERKVTPPPPTRCSGTQLSEATSQTWKTHWQQKSWTSLCRTLTN